MTADRREFERLEQIIYRSTGDMAAAFGRGLERLEDRIDEAEMALRSRLAELEVRISMPAGSSAD